MSSVVCITVNRPAVMLQASLLATTSPRFAYRPALPTSLVRRQRHFLSERFFNRPAPLSRHTFHVEVAQESDQAVHVRRRCSWRMLAPTEISSVGTL